MASPSRKMDLQNSSKKGAGLQTGRVSIVWVPRFHRWMVFLAFFDLSVSRHCAMISDCWSPVDLQVFCCRHGNGSNPAVCALLLPIADTCHTHGSISISRMRQYSSSGWIALLCLPQAVDCNSASDQFKDITRGSIFHHEKYIIGSYRRSSCID